jgi:hypothetical protein
MLHILLPVDIGTIISHPVTELFPPHLPGVMISVRED